MIYQFEMWFTNEYVEDLVTDFAKILKLEYEKKDIDKAMGERDGYSLNNLLLIRGEGCLLCIDCNDRDYIFPLVAICQENVAEELNIAMLEWDNKIRKQYVQKPREKIVNVYYEDRGTLLRQIEEFYSISIHDEFLKYE